MCKLCCSSLWLLLLFPLHGVAQKLTAVRLQCESRIDPLGIDVASPALGWQIISGERGCMQSAYQIQVGDNPGGPSGSVWNSGRQVSDQSNRVRYAGKALLPAHTYYWRVQVWDNNHHASAWSETAAFTTGLFTPSDWNRAQWIGYEALPDSSVIAPGVHHPDKKKLLNKGMQRAVVPLFRKAFTLNKKITRALAFISGLGQYELSINGKKAGNGFLTPGWTYYDKRCLYNTYDVTGMLHNGGNAIGVMVGNGFHHVNRERYFKLIIAFGLPRMICSLHLTYEDGSTETVVSDASWKTAPSPVTYTSIYGGEDYDARMEQQGWNQPTFNDAAWQNALPVSAPKGMLEAEKDYPVQVKEVLEVKQLYQPRKHTCMYDFGQNASGIIRLTVKGRKGQSVRLTPAELVTDSNLANQKATGSPYYFTYTMKGDGVETWTPRFSYYGFRYVQADGAVPGTAANPDDLPRIVGISFLHTGNSAPEAGTFECSNLLFNQINQLIRWAIKSNVQSVVTDCPHREKLSWLEQDHLMGGSIHDNVNVYLLYKKLVYDMMDAQTPEGLVPDIAPEFVFFDDHGFGFRDSPEWGSASVIVPWLVYKWYGDSDLIRTAYPMMKKYVAYLESRSSNQSLSYGLGDWYDYGPQHPGVAQLTPKALTATAIYFYDVALLGRMALLLNDPAEAARLNRLAAAIKTAFNRQFFNEETKLYATGSQTAMAMPLCVGLVEEENRKDVLKNLSDSIVLGGRKLTAGDIGFHFLVQALYEGGASQLIYEMNNRDDVPGYGYQLKKGATALTESWPALKEVSNNHLMLGHLMEWFYSALAGISQPDSAVAYRDMVIRPEMVGDISYVKGSHQSVYGNIVTAWRKNNGRFSLDVQVPPNSRATVYLPASAQNKIIESGLPVDRQKGIRFIGFKNGRAIIKTGSGSYHFIVQ